MQRSEIRGLWVVRLTSPDFASLHPGHLLRDTVQLLSCEDVVQMIRHRLPSKASGDEEIVSQIASRHQRRIAAMHAAYRRQERELASTDEEVNLSK